MDGRLWIKMTNIRQPAAPTGRAIKVITAFVLALNAALYVGAFCQRVLHVPAIALLMPAMIVTVTIAVCYFLWTPVSYELSNGELRVAFRIGRKRYGPVARCTRVESPLGFTLRLFGNGGLFAGSGIFWNRRWGVFRAYVTTDKPVTLVLVETEKTKILISPEDPRQFVEHAPPTRHPEDGGQKLDAGS